MVSCLTNPEYKAWFDSDVGSIILGIKSEFNEFLDLIMSALSVCAGTLSKLAGLCDRSLCLSAG